MAGAVALAVCGALTTGMANAAKPAAPAVPVDKPGLLALRSDDNLCLTFVIVDKIPTAVMAPCVAAPVSMLQEWTFTADGQLTVSLTDGLLEPLPTGVCLDTAADLVPVELPADTPVLVLPCRKGTGQQWTYDEATGSFVNKANELALSPILGLDAVGAPVVTRAPNEADETQGWDQVEPPGLDLSGSITFLMNLIFGLVDVELDVSLCEDLLAQVSVKLTIPPELWELPDAMVDQVPGAPTREEVTARR
jgi:hypothetical protein